MKIGKILLAADLISQDSLQEALTIAQELQQPIGKVLTSTQQISDQALQSALLAQSMLAEGLVEEHVAMETLKLAVRNNVPFGQALAVTNQAPQKSAVSSELEELLLASGMVSAAVLDDAKRRSFEANTPLGNSLMQMRAIVFAHLNYTFECINLINEGRLSKQAAIKALADVKKDNVELSVALKKQKISPRDTQSKLKLGDLLTAGTVISEKDSLAAVERALAEKRLIGEILVKSNLVSAELLQNALDMQNLAIKGVITKDEAAYVLRQSVVEKKSIGEVMKERKSLEDDPETAGQAIDLLIAAKLVEPQAVPQAMAKQQRYEMDALKALVACGFVNAEVYRAAIECARQIAADTLSQQDAVSILDQCDRTRCEFENAHQEITASRSLKKVKETRSSGKFGARVNHEPPCKLPTWSKSIELKLAVIAVIVGFIGGIAVMLTHPSYLAGYCVCGVILTVGMSFFALGRIWELRVKETKKELQKQEEAAQQQVNRLVKIRAKETY